MARPTKVAVYTQNPSLHTDGVDSTYRNGGTSGTTIDLDTFCQPVVADISGVPFANIISGRYAFHSGYIRSVAALALGRCIKDATNPITVVQWCSGE